MSAKMNKENNPAVDSVVAKVATDQQLFQEFIQRSAKFSQYKAYDSKSIGELIDFRANALAKSKASSDTEQKENKEEE